MNTYVISLPDTVDRRLSQLRRAHIEDQLAKARLPYRFMPGVDGARLTPQQKQSVSPAAGEQEWLVPGIIGAALAHIDVYREILRSDDAAAVILEDDATISPTLGDILEDIAASLDQSEVVLLYWRTWPGCQFSSRESKSVRHGHTLMFPMDPHKLTCAAAYVVSRGACQTMIDALLPIRDGADHWGAFHDSGAFETLRCVVPRAAGTRTDFKSTIEYLDRSSLSGRLTGLVARRRLFPLHQLLSARRTRLEAAMSAYSVVDQPSPLARRSNVSP